MTALDEKKTPFIGLLLIMFMWRKFVALMFRAHLGRKFTMKMAATKFFFADATLRNNAQCGKRPTFHFLTHRKHKKPIL